MLKFSTKAGTSVQRMKALACSDQELIDSIENFSAASEALYECGADGAELTQVMDNLSLAMEAINQGGLTAELLGTFNSEGELSACCGLENLTVAGLEAMSDKQVEKLEDKYVAGLEGKMAEYWAKFVAWLKNLWAKIKAWFAALFVNRAKFSKKLDSLGGINKETFDKNKSTKLTVVTPETLGKMLDLCDEIGTTVKTFAAKCQMDNVEIPTTFTKFGEGAEALLNTEAKEVELGKAFGSAGTLDSLCGRFQGIAKSQDIIAASKAINDAMGKLIAEAGKAANVPAAAETAKEQVNKKRDAIQEALKACRIEARLCMKVGANLLKAKKLAVK